MLLDCGWGCVSPVGSDFMYVAYYSLSTSPRSANTAEVANVSLKMECANIKDWHSTEVPYSPL